MRAVRLVGLGSAPYRERKPSTLRDYRSIVSAHLLPEFGDMPVADLTAEGIEA